MITYDRGNEKQLDLHAIYFDERSKHKVIKLLERALNTLSPPDPELNQLLDDIKHVQR